MTLHIAAINGLHVLPAERLQLVSREATVQQMASHLLAGITAGLDLSSDFDVIRYLTNTPERYRAAVVSSHMDAAIYEARQVLVAATMGRG
jgi:hypothetical protein